MSLKLASAKRERFEKLIEDKINVKDYLKTIYKRKNTKQEKILEESLTTTQPKSNLIPANIKILNKHNNCQTSIVHHTVSVRTFILYETQMYRNLEYC